VVRVIALGASSTFGYLDRDDETYPHQLEQRLSERLASEGCSDVRRFEVLNLGIPHLDSSGIYALFMSEGLAFEPDVVTFYEGANDTRRIERSLGERALLELSRVSVAMLALAELIETRLESFDALDLERHLRGVVERFLGNLARIADECERRGIRFVVVSQQARSFAVPDERLAQVGYDEEAEIVRAELDAGQRLDLARLQFLMHAQITSALRAWVAARGVPFVDFIAALEQEGQRASLMSWVHLAPAGNRVLADRLAREIFASVCPSD
jgi:lysophospholipase L1-like esterase